jgi:hypothetical protein
MNYHHYLNKLFRGIRFMNEFLQVEAQTARFTTGKSGN